MGYKRKYRRILHKSWKMGPKSIRKKDKEIENLKNSIKNLEQEKQNKSGSFLQN